MSKSFRACTRVVPSSVDSIIRGLCRRQYRTPCTYGFVYYYGFTCSGASFIFAVSVVDTSGEITDSWHTSSGAPPENARSSSGVYSLSTTWSCRCARAHGRLARWRQTTVHCALIIVVVRRSHVDVSAVAPGDVCSRAKKRNMS